MLMHEWIRYRSQQVKQAQEDEEKPEAAEAADEESAEAEEQEEAVAEAPVEAVADEAAAEAPADEAEAEPEAAQAPPRGAESTLRDREAVLSSLQEELERAGHSMKERLSALQARQRQLPIDVDEAEEDEEQERGSRGTETRQDLIQRLLDPTLTLREAALLIDVCPTTVRRYTNRGLLNCFRTPGNQRRFHLSDVLEFLERRERGEI